MSGFWIPHDKLENFHRFMTEEQWETYRYKLYDPQALFEPRGVPFNTFVENVHKLKYGQHLSATCRANLLIQAKKIKVWRDDPPASSDDEDNIPLSTLRNRLKATKKQRKAGSCGKKIGKRLLKSAK